MRSSRYALPIAVLLIGTVATIPAAGHSEPLRTPKPIGKLLAILHDDVYVGGKGVTAVQDLYAGRAIRTAARGRVKFKLNLKDTICTMQRGTRIIVLPAPRVALRVTSQTGRIWCGTADAKGTASFEGPAKHGKRTVIATKDPVFGLVVTKQSAFVKVRRGAVVVAGRSGRKRAIVVGGARQAVVPHGGDPRQPEPIQLTATEKAVATSLAAAVPTSDDTKSPGVKLLSVPGVSEQIVNRFKFTTSAQENGAEITYSCSFDGGGFFVCPTTVMKNFGPGPHSFEVRAIDAAGNFGKVVRREWSVERPPVGWITFESNRDGNYEIYAMNADGSGQTRLTSLPAVDVDPAWSPNGDKVIFESDRDTGRSSEIYVMNVDGSDAKRLTTDPANDRNPKFSPSGKQIAFESNREGDYEIYTMTQDGSRRTRLTSNDARDSDPAWSPDGTKIAFESDRDGNQEIYVMNRDGSGQTRLTTTGTAEFNPSWSPDGSKIAFDSDRSGNHDIYVMNADGSAPTSLTAHEARDTDPTWSPDGSRIAFTSNRGRNVDIYAMNPDGSDQTRLTTNPEDDLVPNW